MGSAPLIGGVISASGLAVLPLEAVAAMTNGRSVDVDPQLR
ncbi:secreted protein [Cutibacterium acnes JCM 18916]|nr:secreted protein [Cutibacterium acnes JCM 18916]GAE76589.1 secreted protein [Cutibacterium acnes JCM 18918]